MSEASLKVTGRMEAATVFLISGVVCGTFLVGYALRWVLAAVTGYTLAFGVPMFARVMGGLLVVVSLALSGATVRARGGAKVVLDSTAVTLFKLVRGSPPGDPGARTEPFVPRGPYRWVRNPMYLGVALAPFGLAVLFASSAMILWGVAVVGYLLGFLIPREERELEALFGETYREYKSQVPMLFPTGRRYRPQPSR